MQRKCLRVDFLCLDAELILSSSPRGRSVSTADSHAGCSLRKTTGEKSHVKAFLRSGPKEKFFLNLIMQLLQVAQRPRTPAAAAALGCADPPLLSSKWVTGCIMLLLWPG